MPRDDRRQHIELPDRFTETAQYVYPKPVRGSSQRAARTPAHHGASLLGQIARIRTQLPQLESDRETIGLAEASGIVLEFESEPGFPLALKSLDRRSAGIELLSVRSRGNVTWATVFVPEGQLGKFERLIEDYRTKLHQRWQTPLNETLVANISSIRRAVLDSLWTDPEPLPGGHTPCWWEVWLRDDEGATEQFTRVAEHLGMRLGERSLRFPDRVVRLARASAEQMASSVDLLDCIAELRTARALASFFTGLPSREQGQWIDELLPDLLIPTDDAPAVCLLDSGVHQPHPLLAPLLDSEDMHAVESDWGTWDQRGHGTEMAGIAGWGDLAAALAGDGIELPEHRLESVVLIPPPSAEPTDPDLYGAATSAAIALPEGGRFPFRDRVFCLTVMAEASRDMGRPTSWSAELDVLAEGRRDEQARLIIVSAGTVHDQSAWAAWPERGDTEGVHDPGQAWNALTVGACTDLAATTDPDYSDWTPIAPAGANGPSTTTSLSWSRVWPNKPDIVMEGGNAVVNDLGDIGLPDDLRLLTTDRATGVRLFTTTGDTSAASALAARFAIKLKMRYPALRPETIRALIVHSARWTPAMQQSVQGLTPARSKEVLLRRHGWGVPGFQRAAFSVENALTMIAERTIVPFTNTAPAGRAVVVKTNDWHLFTLPWPKEALQALGEVTITLRVTLSYFVEPNPAERGRVRRHRYQSCGLRFKLQNAYEPLDDFRARVSKVEQDEESGLPSFSEPGWELGQLRDKGCLHCDWWVGSAADLAAREHLAVFPVDGWWRHSTKHQRWDEEVSYALVVGIEAPEVDVDLYALVAAEIGVPIEIEI